MIPSSTRTRPSPTWTRSVQNIHRVSLSSISPHPLTATSRFRPPVLPISIGRSELPSSSSLSTLHELRSRPLLPANEPRPKMRRHKPVRLEQRRSQRWIRIARRLCRRKYNRWTGPGSPLWTERNWVRLRPGLICNFGWFNIRRSNFTRWSQWFGWWVWFLRNRNGFGRWAAQNKHMAMDAGVGDNSFIRRWSCSSWWCRRRRWKWRWRVGSGVAISAVDHFFLVDIVEIERGIFIASCHPPPPPFPVATAVATL